MSRVYHVVFMSSRFRAVCEGARMLSRAHFRRRFKMAAQNEGIWRPYKELLEIVERAVYRKRPEYQHDLELALKKFKPDFMSLLKNPAKNPVHRNEIKKASTNGIYLHGQQEKQKLPEQFIQEALILSDILDLNEYICTELLLAGEQQQPNFPGMTRGLVAVLLYHDGRRCLISALKILLQSRDGITWTLGLNEDLSQLITVYTEQLLEEGLINTILKQLGDLSIQSELEKLQKGQAIGDERHKRQLIDFITDQRQLLAESLFCAACQSTLSRSDCLQLISFLKKCPVTEADGTLDSVTLTLLMAMLYCFNVEPLDEASEMQTSFNEDSLPLLSDQNFIPDVHQELCQANGWANQGLLATIQFAWSLVLRSCSQWASLVGAVEMLEDDGAVFDMAVEGGVFGFLRLCVIGANNFHHEDYFVRRLHSVVTGFIVKMPLKVKELRNHGDEACRILQACLIEGREPPPDIPRHFEDFLKLIGDLYSQDPSELHLSADYWCPPEPVATPFSQYSNRMPPLYNQRLSSKQVSLNKFVRLAGDLLPASLFVPYMEMLAGLSTSPQAAHHCFNMLKTTANNSISWDHFFTSIKQYYMDLRQDGGHAGLGFGSKEVGHSYRSHMGSRGITPIEQEALMAVLRVTQRIAEQDETARITLCESQAWLPVASLFGLLSCPIDIRLKGCILDTLAAFAKSPEIAASMWHTLELSQILVTVKQPGQTTQDRGIQVELNEIEARSETYPVTRAFLKLSKELTDIPIPASLGAGYRMPGFEPYLVYLRDDVFLKFNSRGYQDNKEKWQVACGVLEVLFKLLDDYVPQPGDFVDQVLEVQGGEKHIAPKTPGFTLMIHMLNDTPMLRMMLSIIDNASSSLEQLQATADGRSELERTALLCLRMVEVTLEKQAQFMDMLRTVPQAASVMLNPLDQLLMSINPQSQSPDYLLKIARYLTISHISPELSLSAIKVLCQVCQSQAVQSHLVGLLTADKATSLQILIGFVEHLEINEPEESLSKDLQEIGEEFLDEKSYGTSQLRNATRQNIIRLMLYSLDFPAPNLAHFLLGYELRRPVAKTNLQLPGVLGAPKTCLHAILQLINNGTETHRGPTCITEAPRFAELSYKLIYHLCANKDTSMPTLRYLRTSHDFLYQHMQHLPFNKLVTMEIEEGLVPPLSVMNQQSWLLKTAAIELKVTAQSRQRSHTQRLLALLLNEPSALGTLSSSLMPDLSRTVNEDTTALNSSQSFYQNSVYATEPTANPLQMRRKILNLLDSVEFTQDFPNVLQLNYFDQGVTERVIASCEQKADETGVVYCNIRELHRLLNNEISGVQGAATAGQKNFLLQEVREILQHVVQRNMVRENLQGKKEALESWRQVVEVMLATCSYDILPRDTKQAMILETLQDLLMKIAQENALTELTSPVSGVILTLMTHLRHSTLPGDTQATSRSTLDRTAHPQSMSLRATSTPSGPLFAILRGIIEAVLRSGGGLQRVRANLYAAMLYFMQMAQKPQGSLGSKGVLEGVLSQPGESWELGTLSVLSSYGEPLMEVICRDACDGHDVGRMLAFSLLDSIVTIDWQKRWLNYFNLKGFLRNIIEGLVQEDDRLLAMLDPSPEPLKALYIYESKMALLTCIAQSQEGAEVLLQSGLMSRLAECNFLNRRPEYESRGSTGDEYSRDSFVPSVMERYRQLLIPALKVIGAVLTSLGRGHREASMKVLGVVVAHSDVFISILQDRQLVHDSSSLQELALVTSIICNAGLTEASFLEDESLLEDELRFRGPLARIQRLMMALLPKYCSMDYWDKVIKSAVEQNLHGVEHETASVKLSIAALETGVKLHQICASIVAYCRTVVNTAGSSGPQYHVVFGPSLSDVSSRESRIRRDSFRTPPIQSHRPPRLGLLVNVVKECAERAFKAVETHKQTSMKLENIHELTSEELKEVIQLQTTIGPQEKISTHQRQQLAQKCLSQIVNYKTQEIDSHLYIIESSLFILWRHLDFFFLHCIPSDEEHTFFHGSHVTGRMRKLHEWSTTVSVSGVSSIHDQTTAISDGVTRDEIETLKQEASNCLTDLLLKKLVDLEQNHGQDRTRVGFIRVLVRRIKRLLTLHCSLVNEPIPGR